MESRWLRRRGPKERRVLETAVRLWFCSQAERRLGLDRTHACLRQRQRQQSRHSHRQRLPIPRRQRKNHPHRSPKPKTRPHRIVILLPEKLFYNTGAPGAIIIFNLHKPAERKGKVLFINASKEAEQHPEVRKLNRLRIPT